MQREHPDRESCNVQDNSRTNAALEVARRAAAIVGPKVAETLALQARLAFVDALSVGCYVAAGVTITGSIAAFLLLPDHPTNQPDA